MSPPSASDLLTRIAQLHADIEAVLEDTLTDEEVIAIRDALEAIYYKADEARYLREKREEARIIMSDEFDMWADHSPVLDRLKFQVHDACVVVTDIARGHDEEEERP